VNHIPERPKGEIEEEARQEEEFILKIRKGIHWGEPPFSDEEVAKAESNMRGLVEQANAALEEERLARVARPDRLPFHTEPKTQGWPGRLKGPVEDQMYAYAQSALLPLEGGRDTPRKTPLDKPTLRAVPMLGETALQFQNLEKEMQVLARIVAIMKKANDKIKEVSRDANG
jgi:hypothetical protein